MCVCHFIIQQEANPGSSLPLNFVYVSSLNCDPTSTAGQEGLTRFRLKCGLHKVVATWRLGWTSPRRRWGRRRGAWGGGRKTGLVAHSPPGPSFQPPPGDVLSVHLSFQGDNEVLSRGGRVVIETHTIWAIFVVTFHFKVTTKMKVITSFSQLTPSDRRMPWSLIRDANIIWLWIESTSPHENESMT